MSSLAKLLTSFKIGVSKTQSKRRKMEEKTKNDSEIITRAIKEMEEEGMLYKKKERDQRHGRPAQGGGLKTHSRTSIPDMLQVLTGMP